MQNPSRRRLVVLLLVALLFSVVTCRADAFSLLSSASAAASRQSRSSSSAVVVVTSISRGGAVANRKRTVSTKRSASSASTATSERNQGGGGGTATIPNEVFNLVKSIAGSGVLSLPYGIAAYGNAPSALIPALAVIAIMGGLSGYTFGLIGRICQKTRTSSYSDAWDKVVGKKSSPLIAFSCFIDCFAGNISYSMILADTLVNLLASAGIAVTRTQSLLGVTSLVLLPLCLMKNLSSLAPFSLMGIIGMLYTTVAMGIRYFGGAYATAGGRFFDSQLTKPVFGSLGASSALSPKSLILMCMLSNAYIAHFNAPKFLSELKNNTMARFHQVIGYSFGTCVLLYGLITSFGYLTFGSACNGLVLNNYSVQDKLMSLSRIAIAISITCSYPLIFVGARDGIMDLFKFPASKRTDNATLNKLTLGLLAVVTAISAKITDLGLVAAIGGATFGTALVFVYPVIMFLKSQAQAAKKTGKSARTKETLPALLIGIIGVAMGAIGTVFSLQGAEM